MIERGGKTTLVPVKDAKLEILGPRSKSTLAPEAHTIYTDGPQLCDSISSGTSMPNTRPSTTAGPTVSVTRTPNTIENAFSLLKRGVYAPSIRFRLKHLGRYCHEFFLSISIAAGAIADVRWDAQSLLNEKAPALQKAHGFARIGVLGPRRP